METTVFVLAGVLILLIGYIIVIYNRLLTLQHGVDKSWANIDVLLKQRHDELPKLVETCKQYMANERTTLENVIAARNQAWAAREAGDTKGVGKAENSMRLGLGNLFAVAENYPDLKADQSFQKLQSRISAIENAIADRREFYNESVNLYNVRQEVFPDVLVAKRFAHQSRDLLEFDASEITDVNVKSLFN